MASGFEFLRAFCGLQASFWYICFMFIPHHSGVWMVHSVSFEIALLLGCRISDITEQEWDLNGH